MSKAVEQVTAKVMILVAQSFNACITQHRREYSSQNSHPDRPKPQYKIDDDRVVIWCDYACIEQDNPEKMRQGIASLISYAARSDVIVTPVQTGT